MNSVFSFWQPITRRWPAAAAAWSCWRVALAVGVATLICKFIFGLFLLHIPTTPVGLDEWSIYTRFTDIEWELQIAHSGYDGGGLTSWVAKHPLYPGLLRLLIVTLGLSDSAAVTILQFASVVLFAAGLHTYVRLVLGEQYADNAAFIGIFSPLMGGYAAFFGMPDVLGGAFMWWALVAFHTGALPLAGVWAVLAVATRPQGIAVPLVLGAVGGLHLLGTAWRARSLRGLAGWSRLLWLVPALLWYLWYLDITSMFTQVPLAPITAQTGSFRGTVNNPLYLIGNHVRWWLLSPGAAGISFQTNAVYSFGWCACAVLTSWSVLRRRVPVEILLIGLLMTLIPASTALYGLGRYIQFSPLVLGLMLLVPRDAGWRTTALLGLGILLTGLAVFLLVVVNREVGYDFLP